MKRHFLLAAALAAFASPALAQSGQSYRALGTEPFWSVSIGNGRITYEAPEERRLSIAAPAPRQTANGRRYVTRRITIDIRREECSDGMSDYVYADTVAVTVDGRRLQGCGGGRTDASRFEGAWRIVAINGVRVSGANYALTFTDGRLTGQAGCNRLSGSYRVQPRGLVAGPIMATRMACPGARMRHERAVLDILRQPARVSDSPGEEMTLSNAAGSIRLHQTR